MKRIIELYRVLPSALRKVIGLAIKLGLTGGAFYVLLTHQINSGDGEKSSVWQALSGDIGAVDGSLFVMFVAAATLTKLFGVFCSMLRWHILLIGQGIRFNFSHIVGSFLIGRFFGTFLPSTIGLDAYKLYDASRFSKRTTEVAAATVVEKILGQSGLFLTFLVAAPLGHHILYDSLGENADKALFIAVPTALGIIVTMFFLLLKPAAVQAGIRLVPAFGRERLQSLSTRVSRAASAYRGKAGLLAAAVGLSFMVHFTTAAMYYFTALAVGAAAAAFWPVVFGSSVQIFATVLAPSIGGEGIRELAHLVMLKEHLGASAAVMSATLGFLAAEAPTIPPGVLYWWLRRKNYQPSLVQLSGGAEDAPDSPEGSNGPSAASAA